MNNNEAVEVAATEEGVAGINDSPDSQTNSPAQFRGDTEAYGYAAEGEALGGSGDYANPDTNELMGEVSPTLSVRTARSTRACS